MLTYRKLRESVFCTRSGIGEVGFGGFACNGGGEFGWIVLRCNLLWNSGLWRGIIGVEVAGVLRGIAVGLIFADKLQTIVADKNGKYVSLRV